MRIDLKRSFPEIEPLLRAPAKIEPEAARGPEFARLLSDIAPEKAQGVDLSEKVVAQGNDSQTDVNFAQQSMRSSQMGALTFNPPSPAALKQPGLQRIPISSDPHPTVGESAQGVKVPTVLSVERTQFENSSDMTEMTRQERKAAVRQILEQVGPHHGVDPLLGLAVASAESGYNPNAVSSDGHHSKGLFQLLDSTASSIIRRENLQTEYTPFDPQQNTELGVRYLRYLHDLFNTEQELSNKMTTYAAANSSSLEKLAVAAFNAGEGRVASAQDRAARAGVDPRDYENIATYLPKSTQEYVQKVLAFRDSFEADELG